MSVFFPRIPSIDKMFDPSLTLLNDPCHPSIEIFLSAFKHVFPEFSWFWVWYSLSISKFLENYPHKPVLSSNLRRDTVVWRGEIWKKRRGRELSVVLEINLESYFEKDYRSFSKQLPSSTVWLESVSAACQYTAPS